MISYISSKDLLTTEEFVSKPVNELCHKINEDNSKRIILSSGRGTGKSVILQNMEKISNQFIYMKFDAVSMGTYNDIFDEKFYNHYYELIFSRKLLIYIKNNYEYIYNYFEDINILLKNHITKMYDYINNAMYDEKISIDKYFTPIELTSIILEKLKKYLNINSLYLGIDRFDWTNGSSELTQNILSKFFAMFEKVIITSDDEKLIDESVRTGYLNKGYVFTDIDYGKDKAIVKEIIRKRIEYYNINVKNGEKTFPKSIMTEKIYESLINEANGNISLILECLSRVTDAYQLIDSRNFDLENQFAVALDNQKGQIKALKKMDACPPRLYL